MTDSTSSKHTRRARQADQPAAEHAPRAKDLPPAIASLVDSMSHEALAGQYVQLAADFDNFRKRAVADLEAKRQAGIESALHAILPVFDNLERAVDHAGKDSDPAALVQGLGHVLRAFGDALSSLGVTPIEDTGAAFDPSRHEAIARETAPDVEKDTVAEVVQKGYAVGQRVVRPALVKVVSPEPVTAPPDA